MKKVSHEVTALAQPVRELLTTLASCTEVLIDLGPRGSTSDPGSSQDAKGGSKKMAQLTGFCRPCGRPEWGSCLLLQLGPDVAGVAI